MTGIIVAGTEFLIDYVLPGGRSSDGVNRTIATVTEVNPDDSISVRSDGFPQLCRLRSTGAGWSAVFSDRNEIPVVACKLI
ncbi:MAG: hypothetical protein HZC01_04030 [Candidatus Kerfeldbacteria bacterium]|nr:hypothetical protein [Candidatus Kerfeldbacteria bacterium]